jgi:hypothetical protein
MNRVLLLMLLPGCVLISEDELAWRKGSGPDGTSCTKVVFWADADDDGFGDSRAALQVCPEDLPSGFVDNYDDCDDGDPTVNVYQDWYRDADGDGFGAEGSDAVPACAQPVSYVAAAGDCDDADQHVNPDASEVCNGADDDCDGDVDDDDDNLDADSATTFYADSDGDGYGSADDVVMACEQPANTATNSDDCADDDDAVAPGLEEVCNDGKDNDCDGTDNGCAPSGHVDLADTTWAVTGASAGDTLGAAIAGGDINGDGLVDLLLGAPLADSSGTTGGDVFVVSGPVTGSANVDDIATAHITSVHAGDHAGQAVWAGQDQDGDGYSDLVISAPYADVPENLAGSVFLLDGPLTGSISLGAATRIDGLATYDRTGFGIDYGNDIDGDGVNDLVVGVFGESTNGATAGAAFLMVGPVTSSTDLSQAVARLMGQEGDRAGIAVQTVGDMDGDGVSELAIAGDRADQAGSGSGTVFVVGGALSGDVYLQDVAPARYGAAAKEQFGTALAAAGDLDGDGYADLLVGAPGWVESGFTGAGAVYVVRGPVTGVASVDTATEQLSGADSMDAFGSAVSLAGDINGDGTVDIAVGAPGADAAYVFYGPFSGARNADDADLALHGVAGDLTGSSISGVGDINDDAFDDLLIGAPRSGNGTTWIVTGGGL